MGTTARLVESSAYTLSPWPLPHPHFYCVLEEEKKEIVKAASKWVSSFHESQRTQSHLRPHIVHPRRAVSACNGHSAPIRMQVEVTGILRHLQCEYVLRRVRLPEQQDATVTGSDADDVAGRVESDAPRRSLKVLARPKQLLLLSRLPVEQNDQRLADAGESV